VVAVDKRPAAGVGVQRLVEELSALPIPGNLMAKSQNV
jgi:hypothetical protein